MFNSSLIQTAFRKVTAGAGVLCLVAGLAVSLTPVAAFAQKAGNKEEAVPAKTRDKETALKEFKADMGVMKKWMKKQEAKAKENPLTGLKLIKQLDAKIAAVKVDGLPSDLSADFKKMQEITSKMAALFKDMPEDDTELMTWASSKFTDAEFSEKIEELGTEGKAASEKLKETGKKYDLGEVLDFDDKDKKEEEEAGEAEDKEEKGGAQAGGFIGEPKEKEEKDGDDK